MELNTAQMFFASNELTRTADVYRSINDQISTMGYQDAFESSETQDSWVNLHESIWSNIALTHDNLHEAAAALIIYINAMCAQDEGTAEKFLTELQAFEEDNDIIDAEYGGAAGEYEIPDVDIGDREDGILDVPEYETAKKPRGNSD